VLARACAGEKLGNDVLALFAGDDYAEHRSDLRALVKEAQAKAKERGVNLFVIRPDEIPPGLGLLEIDSKVIEFVKNHERQRMKEYIASLDTHNLRFAPPIL